MARTNKYASLNFNDIYEKKITNSANSNTRSHSSSPFSSPSSSSSASSSLAGPNRTIISNSRIHGHMLVLSRPTPKPITVTQKSDTPTTKAPAPTTTITPETDIKLVKVSDQTGCEPDSISLRPQGRTGSGLPIILSPLPSPGNPPSPSASPLFKSDRFVPPHLRPGFSGQEERPGSELVKGGQGREKGQFGSPNRYVEEGRPKSGGGHDRMRRNGGEADSGNVLSRPGSSGARPRSSGGRMF